VFVDYYEVLQISPNADQETVRRVYRIQAQRFHPDNLGTGDAYEVSGDPQSRNSYDADHRKYVRAAQGASVAGPPPDPRDEPQRRAQIPVVLSQTPIPSRPIPCRTHRETLKERTKPRKIGWGLIPANQIDQIYDTTDHSRSHPGSAKIRSVVLAATSAAPSLGH
jgi:curved DNA-binding protein CbpA